MLRRSSRHRWAILLLLPLFVLALHAPSAHAKSYSIPKAEIDLILDADGTLQVTERRTYHFEGAYTFAYQQINLWGQSRIAGIGLEGPTGSYYQAPGKAPGTYTWDGHRITWYFQAKDQGAAFHPDLSGERRHRHA